MIHQREFCPRQLTVHGILGALVGATVVFLLLALNVFGLGAMIAQVENAAIHLAMMFMKPMMLFGVIAVGWSFWRQVGAETFTEIGRFDLAKRVEFFDEAIAARA